MAANSDDDDGSMLATTYQDLTVTARALVLAGKEQRAIQIESQPPKNLISEKSFRLERTALFLAEPGSALDTYELFCFVSEDFTLGV